MELLSTNVSSRKLRRASLLIYGTCIEEEEPDVFKEFSKGRVPLHVCLEKEHMDIVGFKLATILMVAKPKDITVLSVDGSPHCLQLHFSAEQAKNLTKSNVNVEHYVVEHGKVKKISSEAVEMARHLSRIQELLMKGKCSQRI